MKTGSEGNYLESELLLTPQICGMRPVPLPAKTAISGTTSRPAFPR